MKTAGIIGGFGPETTTKFQLKVVEICRVHNRDTRPPLLIWQTPIPLKIEEDLLLRSNGIKRFIPFLTQAAQRLEKGGADFLVLPCNTLHILIDEIRQSVKIPVISIIEETAVFLQKKHIKRVGLFATSVTAQSNMYQDALRTACIRLVLPITSDQKKTDGLIHEIVLNKENSRIKKELLTISNAFSSHGVHDVLLGCTDLQLVFPHVPSIHVHDTLQILANATVREILK